MQLGFSLSPGGLLLPYHLGALQCLQDAQLLENDTPMAGSSAGAIATMAYGCGIPTQKVLEATIKVSDQAAALGGARGRLLPLLRQQMNDLVGTDEWHALSQQRIGIAYREIFPRSKSILQTSFENREDLFQAVSASCMFPFFATQWPCLLDTSCKSKVPRLVVDGFFSVPRERFGCPDFEQAFTTFDTDTEINADTSTRTSQPMKVDRTIAISVFPKTAIGMTAFDDDDVICPSENDISLESLFRIATQATSREDLTMVYELGYQNAEDWYRQEQNRQGQNERRDREMAGSG